MDGIHILMLIICISGNPECAKTAVSKTTNAEICNKLAAQLETQIITSMKRDGVDGTVRAVCHEAKGII